MDDGESMAEDGTARQEEGAVTAIASDGVSVSLAAEEARVAVAGIPDADLDTAFARACRDGKLAMMRELLALTGHRRVDVHAKEDWAFRMACANGQMRVVLELLGLSGDRLICLK